MNKQRKATKKRYLPKDVSPLRQAKQNESSPKDVSPLRQAKQNESSPKDVSPLRQAKQNESSPKDASPLWVEDLPSLHGLHERGMGILLPSTPVHEFLQLGGMIFAFGKSLNDAKRKLTQTTTTFAHMKHPTKTIQSVQEFHPTRKKGRCIFFFIPSLI